MVYKKSFRYETPVLKYFYPCHALDLYINVNGHWIKKQYLFNLNKMIFIIFFHLNNKYLFIYNLATVKKQRNPLLCFLSMIQKF